MRPNICASQVSNSFSPSLSLVARTQILLHRLLHSIPVSPLNTQLTRSYSLSCLRSVRSRRLYKQSLYTKYRFYCVFGALIRLRLRITVCDSYVSVDLLLVFLHIFDVFGQIRGTISIYSKEI